ncbi:MAG: YfhO family protein [Clostridia bacterium]|nr:YfhO family protein [Clostridia bacterium]
MDDMDIIKGGASDAVTDDAVLLTDDINDDEIPVSRNRGKFFCAVAKVRDRLYGKKYLGLCFAVPALLLFLMYFFRGVYPNGEGSVLVLDLNGQYVYFFEALRDIIKNGGSFVYSFRRALGGEFMGIFAYYLASPLSFIVALFPKENITEAIYTLLVLKCGLCGFTFGFFVHKTRPRAPVANVMFSTMWALCAYAVVMQHNLMWTDNIILLPIVMYGIRKIIREGKMSLYVVSLSFCILSNFYIGYMTCIFSAVYFFLCYASMKREERDPRGVRFHFPKCLLRFGLASLCAVCIGAVIIIPTYYSLTFGKTTFSDPSFAPKMNFDIANALTKLYFGSYDTVRPEGLPFLYTGMLTLLIAPLYFICKKIPLREKIVSSVIVVFFGVSMNISTLDLVWHGMQRPNWLNYRYAYMLCFFLLYWAFRVFEHIKEIKFGYVIATFSVSVAALVVLQKLGYDNLDDMKAVLPSILIMFVYVLLLRGVRAKKIHLSALARSALIFLVCGEMFAAGLVNFDDLDDDVVFSNRTGYRNLISRASVAVDDIKEYDDSFYRFEKTFVRKTNDNMALGIYGISGSTSTLNAETVEFLAKMGYSSRSHWSKYLGETPVSDSLLGIKYIIAEKGDRVYEAEKIFEYEGAGDNKDIETYLNPYAMSICTAVSQTLTNAPFTDTRISSPLERMNVLTAYMISADCDKKVFREADMEPIRVENIKERTIAGHYKYEKLSDDLNARINYTINIDSNDPLYCYFPSEYTRDANLYLNGSSMGTYYENESFRIIDLGQFDAGEQITVSLEPKKDELYVEGAVPYFYYLDTEVYEEVMTELNLNPMTVTSYTDDTIAGKITVPEGKTQIFTSITYDKGWVVTCDGVEVETEEVLDALLTFSLEPGTHDLTLEYKPEPVKWGNIICLLGVAAFVLIVVSNKLLMDRSAKKRAALAASADDGRDIAVEFDDEVFSDGEFYEDGAIADEIKTQNSPGGADEYETDDNTDKTDSADKSEEDTE